MRQTEYFTPIDISYWLGVSACRVRQIARQREIVGEKIGSQRVYKREQLKLFALRPTGRPFTKRAKK